MKKCHCPVKHEKSDKVCIICGGGYERLGRVEDSGNKGNFHTIRKMAEVILKLVTKNKHIQ